MTMSENSRFRVVTESSLWPVYVIGMGAEPTVREKRAPTGEPTYASQTVLMSAGPDGGDKPNKSASVHVLQPASRYDLGTKYVSRGRVFVQPYTPDGGRMTLSITVDELVPADETSTPATSTSGASSSKRGDS